MPNMWTASLLLEFHLILFLRKYKKWTKNILHLKYVTKMENKVKTSHENTTRHDILYICLTKPHIDHYVIYFEFANNDHVNSNNAQCNVSTWNNQRIIFFSCGFSFEMWYFFVCCWLGILDNIGGFIWNQATIRIDSACEWNKSNLILLFYLRKMVELQCSNNSFDSDAAITVSRHISKNSSKIKYIVVNKYFHPYKQKSTNKVHFNGSIFWADSFSLKCYTSAGNSEGKSTDMNIV